MAYDDICDGKLFTRSVCCFLDLDLGSILIDNSFFFVSQKLDLNIIYILFVFDNSMKNVIQCTCVDFYENIRS